MTAATLEQTTLPATTNKPELIAFRQQEAAIAELAKKFMPLKVKGIDDREGFLAVHSARMVVKNTRVAVEKRRKELKADALAYGRQVDDVAKALTELLEPIEGHLEAEESAVVQERERLKREAEEAKRRHLQGRIDALAAVGVIANPLTVAEMSDEAFTQQLKEAAAAHEEMKRRKAEEEAELARLRAERERHEAEAAAARAKAEAEAAERRRAEEAALAEERNRLAEIERKQQAEADRLAAEKKRLDDEAAARQRAAEMEKARQEAAERAKADAEARHAAQVARDKAEAEAKAAREKAAAEAAEAARIKAEQERPHRERIIALADQVDALQVPEGPLSSAVCAVLEKAAKDIRAIAKAKPDTQPERKAS